jgi:hypothetical protein
MRHFNFRSIIRLSIILMITFDLQLTLNAQTKPDGSAPQFLFPEFSTGKVRLKNEKIQSLELNYNTVSEKMVYKKDDKIYDIVNTEIIDTVSIKESKFVPAGQVFYEVLLIAPVSLYIQYQGELIPPGAVAGYGGTSQVSNTKNLTSVNLSMGYYNLKLPDDYTVKLDQIFWIKKDSLQKYSTEKQFLKLFPDKAAELKDFIKKQKIRFDKPADQVILIEFCNELKK